MVQTARAGRFLALPFRIFDWFRISEFKRGALGALPAC